MKNLSKLLLLVAFVATFTSQAFSQSAEQIKTDNIITSYMIALGKQPSEGEINHWKSRGDLSLEQLVANHKQYIAGNGSVKREVIVKAFKDSYGRNPTESEIKTNMGSNNTYSEWVNNHVRYMSNTPSAYQEVLARAYSNVCGWSITENDKGYWRKHPTTAYVYVAATLENWIKQNGKTPKTSGSNTVSTSSRFLNTVSISPQVARNASNLIGAAGGNVVSAGSGNVISAGGGNVISAGGGN